MNKKWLFFALSVFLMVALKHALGQEDALIGWDPVESDPTQDVAAVMMAAPILGAIFGFFRLRNANAFRPVLSLNIQPDGLRLDRLR